MSGGRPNIPKTVKAVEAGSKFLQSLASQTIRVAYPSHWFAPVRLSRFAHTIEEETIRWMVSLGMVPTVQCLAHLRSMEPRHYAGYSHSMAAYDHALAYCKYITTWLLWDDQRVEVATDYGQVEPPLEALAGEEVAPAHRHDPYVIAFRHIGDEYEKLGASRTWRMRFSDRMKEWARHAVAEEKVRRAVGPERAGRVFEDALRLRAVTVGIRPNSIPLERAAGIEVPLEVHGDPDYGILIDQAATICCIVNDLVGVPKDIRNDQVLSNLILYNSQAFGASLKDSYAAILKIHDEAVRTFDCLADRLLKKLDPTLRERIDTFFDYLRYMDSGFGFWHQDCHRYQRYVAVEDQVAFRIAITVEDRNLVHGIPHRKGQSGRTANPATDTTRGCAPL